MLFTEPAFLLCFLPVLIGLYFASPRSLRNLLLLAASLLFYAKGGGRFTYLLIASVAFNYAAAIAIHDTRGSGIDRALLAAAVAGNLLVLGVFKYAGFIVGTVNGIGAFAHTRAFAVPSLVLPIGISFFTFHA